LENFYVFYIEGEIQEKPPDLVQEKPPDLEGKNVKRIKKSKILRTRRLRKEFKEEVK